MLLGNEQDVCRRVRIKRYSQRRGGSVLWSSDAGDSLGGGHRTGTREHTGKMSSTISPEQEICGGY